MRKLKRFFKNLPKNIKEFFVKSKDTLVNFFSKKEYDRKQLGVISLIGVGIVALVVIIIFLFMSKNISQIERNTIMDKSTVYSYYLEYAEDKKKGTDDYIIFALKYSTINNHKSGLSSAELSKLISEIFNVKIDEDTIRKNGISEKMLKENIMYSPSDDVYDMITPKVDPKTIAETQVSYYKFKKLSRINSKKYSIVYQKYIIEDPYKVLNYYIDKNNQSDRIYDIAPYRNYLVGSDSTVRFKESIIADDIQNYAKKDKKYKVTYIVDGDKVLIDKVSRCTLC
ncbi:MAG: hypothetical protein IKP76_04400 [Bacilli bacterium]|nr:hypothetical protein [Bacilli bacterium]